MQAEPWAAAIPVPQIAAAKGVGKFIALGLFELRHFMPLLIEAATKAGYAGDLSGLQTKLSWLALDSARAWQITRSKADHAIRRRLAPLFAARTPSARLLAAARAENRAWDLPLLDHEVVDVAAEEAAWWLRRGGVRRHG